MQSSQSYITEQLTPYQTGSIKEALHVSYPLMISYLSIYLMIFMHRVVLGRFSNEAMNAAATIGLVCFIFDYGLTGIITIVEVLVGKLNGAKKFKHMGQPVWQAIWLCVFSGFICVPLAFYGSDFLIPKMYQAIGTEYYIISILTCPVFGIVTALACFFIGQGRGYIVTIAVIISNILNLILLLCLVFGFWIFPRLGIMGAAVATAVAQISQVLILGIIFFSKRNLDHYGSNMWKFDYSIFKEMFTLGLPNSLSHMLEISAWAIISRMLAVVNNDHVTLFSVGQSLFILVAFFSEGLQKGVMAISANLIGAKKNYLISKSIISATYIHLFFCLILFFIILIANDYIIRIFFPLGQQIPIIYDKNNINCLWVLLYFMLDGLVWIRIAVLTSFGDVKFIMITNITTVVIFAVLPVYIFIVKQYGSSMLSSWQIVSISALVNLLVFYYRSKRFTI